MTTTKPLPTEHHQIDIAGMTALASLAHEQITLITSLIDRPSSKEHDLPSIASSSHWRKSLPKWNLAGKSVQCDPSSILLSHRDVKACLSIDTYSNHRSPAAASKQHLKAIYPQPPGYYLSQAPVRTLVNSSRTRRVKLCEVSISDYNTQAIQYLLPIIDQFLATLVPKAPQPDSEPSSEPDTLAQDTCGQEAWDQAPYFQKYGYRYITHEDPKEQTEAEYSDAKLETTEGETPPQAVPDFVSDPINGTIGPKLEEATTTTKEESGDEESGDTVDDSWFGLPDDSAKKDSTTKTVMAEEEKSDPYEKNYYPYEGRYSNYYKDYAIEYEAYVEDGMPKGERSSKETTEAVDSKEPLHDEVDYYYESRKRDKEVSPSAPNGSFDIYWEATDPKVF